MEDDFPHVQKNDGKINDPPNELFKMLEYLPVEFADEAEDKYIDALILATETSYENGLYQFAYIQYHMIFMTVIYYTLLKIFFFHEAELKNALYFLLRNRCSDFWKETNTKNGKLYFGSFAIISESDVFMLLSVIDLDKGLLGELQKLVQERNKYAHANGQLLLTSDELFLRALDHYNSIVKKVIDLLKCDLIIFYKRIITNSEFYDPDIRAYSDPKEQIIQEFIKEFSISKTELNWLRKIQWSEFVGCEGEDDIKKLHNSLIDYYQGLEQDDN